MGLFGGDYHEHDNSVNIRFPDTVKVEEHRAPTDQSVRLLNEMQQQAQSNIIAQVRLPDNILNAIVFIQQIKMGFDRFDWFCKFKLNGREHVVKGSFDNWEFAQDIKRKVDSGQEHNYELAEWQELVKRVSTVIAGYLTREFMQSKYVRTASKSTY